MSAETNAKLIINNYQWAFHSKLIKLSANNFLMTNKYVLIKQILYVNKYEFCEALSIRNSGLSLFRRAIFRNVFPQNVKGDRE